MAEPERQANQLQPLTAEAEGKIGSFYLSNLLKSIKNLKSPTFLFHEVNGGIFDKIGTRISADLVDKFGLKCFRWIIHSYRDSLPILALGKNTISQWTSDGINDAVVTIEIARKTDHSDGHEKTIPFYLGIAGVNEEQGRIVAVKYDLTDNNRLIRLNVSIGGRERFLCRHPDLNTEDLLTNVNHPYRTAGLITKTMIDNIDGMHSYIMHSVALTLELDNDSPSSIRTENIPWACNDYNEGFRALRKNGMIIISSKENSMYPDLRPWEISVPEFLQKI